MPKKHFLFAIAFYCLWLFPSEAFSAPFCIEVQGLPLECLYYDIGSCKQEAEKRDGYCSVNTEEIALTDQGAPYCIIDSSMMPICAFQGGESCNEEAAKRNAVCFQNTSGADQNNDPYRFERPLYQYQ